MLKLKQVLLASMLMLSFASSAAEPQKYNDWRLESPFKHGLAVALSLGFYSSSMEHLRANKTGEFYGFPEGTISYIQAHGKFPYALGVASGVGVYLILLAGVGLRVYNVRAGARHD